MRMAVFGTPNTQCFRKWQSLDVRCWRLDVGCWMFGSRRFHDVRISEPRDTRNPPLASQRRVDGDQGEQPARQAEPGHAVLSQRTKAYRTVGKSPFGPQERARFGLRQWPGLWSWSNLKNPL